MFLWYNCMVGCVGLTLFITKIAALFTYAVNHAMCKTVANKGISFVMQFSDPTPLCIAPINHRLQIKEHWQSNSFCLTSDVRCSRSSPPLLHSSAPPFGWKVSVWWSLSTRLSLHTFRNPRQFCRQTDILGISTAVCIAVMLMHSKQ